MPLKRVRSKICGITRPEDALIAVDQGADALGLVFYEPSPRAVSIQQAEKICAAVPAFVSIVGLFVDASKADVETICQAVPLSLLQFHGNEEPEFCEGFRLPYIKAVRVQGASTFVQAEQRYRSASGILADTYRPGVPGGTGEAFDWDLLPKERTQRLILAGGLNASNVRTAINRVNPYAVDVSGGVESEKGIKSATLIEQFLSEVRRGSGSEY